MNKTTNFLALLAAFLLSACSTTDSLLQINCPDTVQVKIPYATAALDSAALPQPVVISHCDAIGYTLSVGIPAIKAGNNTVSYTAFNDCGDQASCTFSVVAEVDFRAKFVGTYHGYRDCSAANQPQYNPDQTMDFIVDYDNSPNYLLVGSDHVAVDTNGYSLNPTLGSYRTYGLSFKGDSIHVYQQWGVINSNETCHFRGKKQ